MPLVAKTKSKPRLHDKKRSGQHHRKSKQYHKAYWPYLPMLLVVGLGVVINALWSPHSAVLGASSDYSNTSLLADTNSQRSQNHEGLLSLNPQLVAAAQAKAADMARRNYWSHTSPDGKTAWSFMSAAGYSYQVAGENLAYGFRDANATITGWMNSPEHRANILDGVYSNVGFGVASNSNFQDKGPAVIVVALYAAPAPAVANITFNVQNPRELPANTVKPTISPQTEPSSRLVSRVQLLTGGQASWSLAVVTLLMGIALGAFIIRHGLRLRKLLMRGEFFIVQHPLIDCILLVIATAGFILTRASGIIR